MSARKDLIFASIEAFAALMLTVLLSSWATSTVIPALGLPKSFNGVLNVLVTVLLLAVAYSQRFRHHQGFWKGSMPCSILDVFKSCIPASAGSTPAFALLSLHGLQLAAIFYLWQSGSQDVERKGNLLQCADASGLVWSPLFEEVLARFLLFYISFQRSRGNLLFSVSVGAFIFALLHFANAAANKTASGGAVGVDIILCLQALLALVAGATYGCIFAASGSLFWVTVVHAANNAVAYAWMLLNDEAGSVVCGARPHYTTGLLVFLCFTLVCYSAVAATVYRGVATSIQTTEGAARFKSLHPLVYEAEAATAGAEAGPAVEGNHKKGNKAVTNGTSHVAEAKKAK
jgi:membrane protease YdiL (CAAX protease family)